LNTSKCGNPISPNYAQKLIIIIFPVNEMEFLIGPNRISLKWLKWLMVKKANNHFLQMFLK